MAIEKKPIRILHVVTIMNRAGLEMMLMNYYRHIDRTKVQFAPVARDIKNSGKIYRFPKEFAGMHGR